jgi:large subunit ribosomal protein L17
MKHRIGFNALNKTSSHRKAMKRSMVTSLFRYERIETTKSKALEVRRMAEKMITRAKDDSVANRRRIDRDIKDEAVSAKLFLEIAPMFAERKGGYTRILKTGNRLGDAAEMVILELVEKTSKPDKKAEKKAEKKVEKVADKKTEKVAEKVSEKKTEKAAPKKAAPKKAAPKKAETSTKAKAEVAEKSAKEDK